MVLDGKWVVWVAKWCFGVFWAVWGVSIGLSPPQTIRDWNDLPESLFSSSELSGDSVSKFTSLVRAWD